MNIKTIEKEDLHRVYDLITGLTQSDYKAYRSIPKDKISEYISNSISDLYSQGNCWIIAALEKEVIIGSAVLIYLPWDTEHFGFNMAKLTYLFAKNDYAQNKEIKKELLCYVLELCKQKRIAHLSCRIGINDTAGVHVLEENGFRIMDMLITYICNSITNMRPNIKDLYKVRVAEKKDIERLISIAENGFKRNRFHLDEYIPAVKAKELYGKWIKNYCAGGKNERVYIAENRNNITVGFAAYRLDQNWIRSGYKIIGSGLSAVSPEAKGAFPGLIKKAVDDVISFYDYAEFDTQIDNYEALKVYQKFGFDIAKTCYTFHKWLG